MAVPKYISFRFLPEDRPELLALLQSHPAVGRVEAGSAILRFRVRSAGAECLVEVGDDHGTLEVVPDQGDPAASLAEELLTEGGAVFTTCC